ncbi:helix-turn-helix transcriptional regulator [Sphingomonas nostoxanthinifaciens]|uniref:helix-turn-helix transcriptional regulator n=1 Tax=Sphingomonas nostoxanthinifaciens TaxID=2872652 RepID=UPI001CC20C21|nr:helix-turn-helix transcriptional regulator [Sphingomonas nostoxanthinifaciens]UAK25682.1 helix-turn-helix transcriptional regulator [Sphingomonas nostoxanthinifaciens]
MVNPTDGARSKEQPDRAQLHRIVEGLSDGVVLIEPDGRIVWANSAALAMHGCGDASDLGDTVGAYQDRFDLRLRDGQPLPKTAYPMARLCRGEAFEDVVLTVRKADREQRDWVHRERGFVLDRDGAPDCLVLIICDATEAFEAEERFESMFNANPAPALILRLLDLRYVRVNEGFLELSGWERDQIVGRSIYDLDILAQAAKRDKAKARLAEGDPIPQTEAELPIPNGDRKLVLLAGHPAEMANNEPCMIFTFADLEPRRRAEMALRQSEERFATAFRFAPVPMLLTTLDGHRILNVNHAFLSLTDWGHDSVVGRKPAEIELFESSATRREIEKKVSESGSFRGYELQVKTRTGTLVTCLASAETVSINGQFCILAAFQDISDRKRTELDLIAAIEGAMQDSSWLSQKIMDRMAALRGGAPKPGASDPPVDLTPREREVLALITRGKTDDAIADTLSLKRNTVRNHVARLYAKIGVHSRAEAVIWARDRGHQLGLDSAQ